MFKERCRAIIIRSVGWLVLLLMFLPSVMWGADTLLSFPTSTSPDIPLLIDAFPLPLSSDVPRERLRDGFDEVVSLRSLTSRIYFNGDTYLARVYAGPVFSMVDEVSFWPGFIPGVSALTTTTYSGAGDGFVGNSGAVWATVRAASAGDAVNYVATRTALAEADKQGATYYVYRGFLPFNTAGLPDDAVVSAATLNLWVHSNTDTSGGTLYAVASTTQAATEQLEAGDFDQIGAILGSGEADPVASQYNVWTLNATGLTWISLTGWTKLGVRANWDYDNSAPSAGPNELQIRYSEWGDLAYQPYLEITYTIAGPPPAEIDYLLLSVVLGFLILVILLIDQLRRVFLRV